MPVVLLNLMSVLLPQGYLLEFDASDIDPVESELQ